MSLEARDALKGKARSKPNTVHYAAEVGDIKALEHFVREGMVMGHPESVTLQAREDVLGMMPIHIASENGQVEVVEFLIKKRVDLDAGDNFRVTAMHLAAIEDHREIVELLLQARAVVKPVDIEGDMPVHWAATKGHSEIIRLLAKKGSPMDVPNNKGWTPLHRAAYNGRKEAVQALIDLGASLTAVTQDGNTPLHLACFMNQLSTIEKLCEHAAPQKVLNHRGQKPYDLCITDGAREILTGLGGFGDIPAPAPKTSNAPAMSTAGSNVNAAAAAPKIPNLKALSLSAPKDNKRLHDLKDGFPSPGASPTGAQTNCFSDSNGQHTAAGHKPHNDSLFLKSALNETGVNPYSSKIDR